MENRKVWHRAGSDHQRNLSDIYKVDFEIMQIEGKPLSIYY